MKRVVGVSLGSSSRDHAADTEFLGERVRIERLGTNGDIKKAVALLRELDGKVDAFGMGGIDLYVRAGARRYLIRDAAPLVRAASRTPFVDGGNLKDILERRTVRYVDKEIMPLRDRPVLMVAAMDHLGMAEALAELGARVVYGDFPFFLGLPIPLRSLRTLDFLARVVAPVVCLLPIRWLYPLGEKQEKATPRFTRLFEEADVIAGDWHLIHRYAPWNLGGKAVLTNTVTKKNVQDLKERGAKLLVVTTPEFEGRSFATNVMEAVLVALSGRRPEDLTRQDYVDLLDRLEFEPRVEWLNP